MTGALKHLFDLVDHRTFAGKPVALAATGGSLMHGLVTEHQLRPLFGFLNAPTLPTTVYAVESDFDDYRVSQPSSATASRALPRRPPSMSGRQPRRSPSIIALAP